MKVVTAIAKENLYDESNVPGPEFRVRTVARYVVTKYCHGFISSDGTYANGPSSSVVGEFHNEQQACEVANALAYLEAHAGATVSL